MNDTQQINPTILLEQFYEIALCRGYTQDEAELFALSELERNKNDQEPSPIGETEIKHTGGILPTSSATVGQ